MAAPNPCAENNGNCSHLCLLSSAVSEGYTCACPDGLVNSEDQNVCRGETHNLNSSLTIIYSFHFFDSSSIPSVYILHWKLQLHTTVQTRW